MNSPRIRVDAPDVDGRSARVTYVDAKGVETDISNCVKGVTLKIGVRDVNTATIECVCVVGHATAELVDVAVQELKPRPRWLGRIRCVTPLGATVRRYVRS